MLLSNSSGIGLGSIGEGTEFAPGSNLPPLGEYLSKEVRIVREPGTGFIYSNPGFNLMELIIRETTGKEFAEYMSEAVLEPLGMENSAYGWRISHSGRARQRNL
jgi:CubicO group peptidase (beta-lactamase class C family)